MNIVTNNKWIGQRTIRPDGVDKVTGRAAFAADTNMPGMIWGKVLRSPHAHARIKSINTRKAEALPGVKAVVTSRDVVDFPIEKGALMLGIQDMRWMCRNVMARDKALFPGHPVAAVAATTEAIAAEACKLIESFGQAEVKMIKYVEANGTKCGIPPQIPEQLKKGHLNTETMQKKVCTMAQQRPAGPSLSEALGSSAALPEATPKKKGGSAFDTLTGNVLTR